MPKAETTKQVAGAQSNAADQKSIAVLPFVNMSADKNDEYLSDGMTEELINVLVEVPGLRVPGRTSCFAFKGKNEEGIFHQVGEHLHRLIRGAIVLPVVVALNERAVGIVQFEGGISQGT